MVAGIMVAQLPGISVQRTIDLDGLASLFVGLILFLGLNLLYQQQSAVARGEKEILIKLAQEAIAASERLDSAFSRCHKEDPLLQCSVEEILASLQRYNNSVHTLASAMKKCKRGSKISLAAIQDNREEYRAVLTETPFPVKYDSGSQRQQQRQQLAVREAFVDLILELNRL
jgi:hypothetical protein